MCGAFGCRPPRPQPRHPGPGPFGAPGLVKSFRSWHSGRGLTASTPGKPGKPAQFLSVQTRQSETQNRGQHGPGLGQSCRRPGGDAGQTPLPVGLCCQFLFEASLESRAGLGAAPSAAPTKCSCSDRRCPWCLPEQNGPLGRKGGWGLPGLRVPRAAPWKVLSKPLSPVVFSE